VAALASGARHHRAEATRGIAIADELRVAVELPLFQVGRKVGQGVAVRAADHLAFPCVSRGICEIGARAAAGGGTEDEGGGCAGPHGGAQPTVPARCDPSATAVNAPSLALTRRDLNSIGER